MKIENFNNDRDAFDVPKNMWDTIEAALDQKEKKRRAIIWWRIAGVGLILLGIGSVLTMTNITPNQKQVAKVNPKSPLAPKKTEVNTEIEKDPVVEVAPTNLPAAELVVVPSPINTVSSTLASANLALTGAITYSWTSPATTNFNSFYSATNATPYTITSSNSNSTVTLSSGSSVGFSNGQMSQLFSSGNGQGLNGGPVNVGRLGVVDGIYISDHVPSKRLIPYEVLGEANKADTISWGIDMDYENSSRYDEFVENSFIQPSVVPQSTFSIDVDGASYSDVRGMLSRSEKPNKNAVRIEEFVNYFPYNYAEPTGEHPFSIHSEYTACPWNSAHKLMKIGIKGQSIDKKDLPKNNLVFLLDVSGSMESAEKLELLKKGFRLLVRELREEDRVSICVYAGAAGLVLPPTSGANKDQILDALNHLSAGGSTAGGEGIELAYATAAKHFDKNGNNRVILATDGDFNVGISNDNALVKLIEEKRESGVFLTVLGFGHDNFQSSKMEKLANNGNGNFSFIDNILEAKKVLVTEMGATLQTIAKDVKIQVEFNPAHVKAYRLIGYENRLLANEDFSNDTVDAGELGAGHTVTAIYEIIPANGESSESSSADDLKYSKVSFEANKQFNNELATMKFRYKVPDGEVSKLIEQVIPATSGPASEDFLFIQAVVEFGLILRESDYAGAANLQAIIDRAQNAKGADPYGYRTEFILMAEKLKLMGE
ncbi:MAG: VWA domain-containing protein [Bacteroidota bacterium]